MAISSSNFDTICAPATIPGTGAVSLIRVSGPGSLEIVDSVVKFRKGNASESTGGRVKFGQIFLQDDGSLLDEVLVNVYKAPFSYTGENSCEISCHASSYIVSEIIRMLIESGCRMADPGEFTQRAFLNGKMDLSQAEAVADVIASSTRTAHHVAVNQLKGGFSKELSALREQLLEMVSLMELELDFSEEDVEFADRSRLNALLDATLDRIHKLYSSFKMGNAIKNGVPVAIVGPTNAGKSTLLNAVLGEQRAIVSDIAGTTRDTIEECLNVDGILFRFVDTAGIRSESSDAIENIGIQRSFESIKKAEIVLVMVDVSMPDLQNLKEILSCISFNEQIVYFVLNKCDLLAKYSADLACNNNVINTNTFVLYIKEQLVDFGIEEYMPQVFEISAKEALGVDKLLKTLAKEQLSRLDSASSEGVLVTNIRHLEALSEASASLLRVRSGLQDQVPTDLVSQDLREALYHLGSITGAISTEEVLGNIFRNFCIGK